VATEKLAGMVIYHGVRKAFGESILPKEVSVGVKLLRLSMDLTDLGREAWTEDDEWKFHGRLKNIEVEYQEVEREMLSLTSNETQAYSIECARLCTQLREIGGTGLSEGSDDEDEYDDHVEEDPVLCLTKCVSENCVGEMLIRKGPKQVYPSVHGGECLGLDLDKCTCEACGVYKRLSMNHN
jgi:hypothetical protein